MPWKRKTHGQRLKESNPDNPKHAKPRKSTKIYGHRWRKAREAYLRKYPLCNTCRANGRHTLASVVDHIVPHKGDMGIFWDSSNWSSECESCHNRKTATQDGGLGNPVKSRVLMINRESAKQLGLDPDNLPDGYMLSTVLDDDEELF